MQKVLTGLAAITLTVSLVGCVTVEKAVRERVDQGASGNQGYINGPAPSPRQAEARTREYIDIKVEVPTLGEVKKTLRRESQSSKIRAEDKGVGGNRGVISGSKSFEEELPPVSKPNSEYEEPVERPGPETISPGETASMPATPQTYKVKEGDSLSKISKEVYGRASKWTIIYEANADKIKDPNKLKTGITLVIPELKEEGKEAAGNIK